MEYVRQIFFNKDLRKRVLFVLFLLFIFRLVSHIPIPVSDPATLKDFLGKLFAQNSFLSFLDIFSGGGISRFSIAMMGVGPYITASIMIQLLTMVIPKFEAMSKEGEQGMHKLNQYSRIIAVPLAFFEGYGMIRFIQNVSAKSGTDVIGSPSFGQWMIMLLSLTAGTIFLMWIGEIITEKGLGNGISLIIFAGILSRAPQTIYQSVSQVFSGEFDPQQLIRLISFTALGIFVVFLVVLITEGERKIPISYAKKMRGIKTYGGIDTHLPLRLNMAGVIPIIFAGAFMNVPAVIGFFTNAKNVTLSKYAALIQKTFAPDQVAYAVLFFILVFAFTFFSTFLYFKPKEVAENIQKQGGFIPGIRPGKETENYLNYLISRITLWGAVFLGAIAVMPFALQLFMKTTNLSLGGTSLLIAVSVALEIRKEISAQIVTRKYEALG